MATSIARLAVHFAADVSGLKAGIAQVNTAIASVGQGNAAQATTGLSGLIQSLGISTPMFGMAAAGIAAIGAGLATIAAVGIPAAAALEQLQVKMEVLTGSAAEASRLVSEVRQLALDTPISIAGGSQAVATLLAMGESSAYVMEEMRMLGDIAAGTGQPLNEVAQVFGQVMQAGRLTGNELRQFNERGIPLLRELSNMYGVSAAKIREMVEEGKIGSAAVYEAFQRMTESGGLFNGMMERMNQTMLGQWEKLWDNMTNTAARFFEGSGGQIILGFLEHMNNSVEQFNTALDYILGRSAPGQAFAGSVLGGGAVSALESKKMEDEKKRLEQEADKAAKEAKKLADDMKKSAENISKSLRTPAEVFADTIRELHTLMGEGLLSWEIYARGVKKAQDTFQSASLGKLQAPTQGIAAVERGTTAAFSAIQQAKREQDAQINQQREMLAVQKQQRKILEDILSETRNKKPVTVAKVDL